MLRWGQSVGHQSREAGDRSPREVATATCWSSTPGSVVMMDAGVPPSGPPHLRVEGRVGVLTKTGLSSSLGAEDELGLSASQSGCTLTDFFFTTAVRTRRDAEEGQTRWRRPFYGTIIVNLYKTRGLVTLIVGVNVT